MREVEPDPSPQLVAGIQVPLSQCWMQAMVAPGPWIRRAHRDGVLDAVRHLEAEVPRHVRIDAARPRSRGPTWRSRLSGWVARMPWIGWNAKRWRYAST